MPRIDEMPDYRAQLPKSVHDLSHKFGFTATVAHLLPVFHDILNPGETIDLSFRYNLRTQPLASAAMVDIKAHVEYFFVPMFLLYEPFGSMFYDLNDNYSSLLPNYVTSQSNFSYIQDSFPVACFGKDASGYGLIDEMQSDDTVTCLGEQWMNHVYRLFDMLGYNNTNMNGTGSNTYNPNVFPWPILAYNCIHEYYYRLDSRESFNQHLFNWDRFYNTSLVLGSDIEFKDWVHLWYRPKDDDYFMDNKVSPIVDVLNLNKKDSFNLAQQWLTRSSFSISSGNVLNSGSVGSSSSFTGAPINGSNSSPSSNIQTQFGFSYANGYAQSAAPVNGLDIGTANIRAMFANEKFWSITGRARKHYDDQTLAHFGIQVPHDVKHQISCFGHDRSQIHIGEVISTTNLASSSGTLVNAGLGEIAGKGYGNMSNKPHRFTAPCHGVVMAILSFVPDVTYGGTYLKANAVASRHDLYIPSFDHLGMQPLFGYECSPVTYSGSSASTIIGWQYRYQQWKKRYNRVTKAFTGTGNLDSWMLDFKAPLTGNTPNATTTSLVDFAGMRYLQYHHDPSELNQIMLVNYVNTAVASGVDQSAIYDGDPFVIDGFVYCKKRSSMSDYSLPRLDA